MLRRRIQLIFSKPRTRAIVRQYRYRRRPRRFCIPLHLLRQLYNVKRQRHNPTAIHGVLTIN